MKMEKEITVLVTTSYEDLHQELINNGFDIKEIYRMSDIYMIDSHLDLTKLNTLDILKKCILVRNIYGIKKVLLYKYKKYDEQENIIEQGKVECPVEDINKAVNFMKAINYQELFTINDENIVYANAKTELAVQRVNDKYLFIELEAKGEESDEDLINEINSYNISFNHDNYYVKKAEIILKETLK